MRISDWSSDVCSSDLGRTGPVHANRMTGATECETRMKPELSLTARSTWRDPVPEKPAGPGRAFWAAIAGVIAVACLAFLLSSGPFRAPAELGRASCRERVCQSV